MTTPTRAPSTATTAGQLAMVARTINGRNFKRLDAATQTLWQTTYDALAATLAAEIAVPMDSTTTASATTAEDRATETTTTTAEAERAEAVAHTHTATDGTVVALARAVDSAEAVVATYVAEAEAAKALAVNAWRLVDSLVPSDGVTAEDMAALTRTARRLSARYAAVAEDVARAEARLQYLAEAETIAADAEAMAERLRIEIP